MELRPIAAALAVVIASGASAADYAMDAEYHPAAKLGLGWNSIVNEPTDGRAKCIDGDSAKPHENADPKTTSTFRLVRSTTDVMDAFEMSAEAAFRGVVYNASGSVSYAQSRNLSRDALNVAGAVEMHTRTLSLYAADNAAPLRRRRPRASGSSPTTRRCC